MTSWVPPSRTVCPAAAHRPSTSTSHRPFATTTTGPIRIAAQKSGGKWYPSVFYAIADYGGLLLRATGDRSCDVTVKDLQLNAEQVSGTATRVTLSSATVVGASNETMVQVDGSCVEVTAQGEHKRMCASDFVTQIVSFLEGFGVSAHVTPAQQQAFEDLVTGFTKVGVDTTESGGQWYVNPGEASST
jgi:hypothetical protein